MREVSDYTDGTLAVCQRNRPEGPNVRIAGKGPLIRIAKGATAVVPVRLSCRQLRRLPSAARLIEIEKGVWAPKTTQRTTRVRGGR